MIVTTDVTAHLPDNHIIIHFLDRGNTAKNLSQLSHLLVTTATTMIDANTTIHNNRINGNEVILTMMMTTMKTTMDKRKMTISNNVVDIRQTVTAKQMTVVTAVAIIREIDGMLLMTVAAIEI